MKHLLLIIGLLCGIAVSSCVAQDGDQRQEGARIYTLKVAFLTRRLNLTPQEAERFWPIYNQYAAEMRQAQIAGRDNKIPTIEQEETLLRIKKKYSVEFVRAIPPPKVNQFFTAEVDFNNFVRKEWMQRREERLQQRRPLIR